MGQFTAFPINTIKPSESTAAPLPLDGTEIVWILVGGAWFKTTVQAIADRAQAIASSPVLSLMYALSDETTAVTAGVAKLTVRVPFAFILEAVRASLSTASSSGVVTVDINEGGSSILGTKLTIDAGEKTSTTAAAPATITDGNLADDAEITFDIDTAGTGATGLKVYLIGRRA